MRSNHILAAALAMLIAFPALAQAPQGTPARIRGTIVKLDDHKLTIKARDGQEVVVTLAEKFNVRAMERRQLADIKANDFVGITSINDAEGKRHAVEVHIFPEAMRGTGEGQYPWDLMPESTMTNGAIAGTTAAPKGQVLKINFKGKEDEIIVDGETQIVAYSVGDASMLKPGLAVVANGQKQPDQSITAAAVNVENNGVKPPM